MHLCILARDDRLHPLIFDPIILRSIRYYHPSSLFMFSSLFTPVIITRINPCDTFQLDIIVTILQSFQMLYLTLLFASHQI